MTNPLKMRKNANGVYTDGVQVMSDAELDYAASVVLAKLGSSTQDVGDIIFDTNLGTSIGTFTDNYAQDAINSHPANTTLLSTTYTLYQNTGSASESSMILPAKLDLASDIKPQTDSDLNSSIIDRCLNKIAEANSTFGEAGTYYITSNTSSTPVSTGTWASVSTVDDQITDETADASETVTYTLYKRTSASITGDAADRPLTIDAVTPSHIKEMTDAQLQTLALRLRNRIVATGIGTYALQSSAPVTGTWVARGTITDRKPTINQVSYSRGAQYTREFTGQYTRESVGYAREYNTAPDVYVRSVYGTGNFTSTRFGREFTGQYTRNTIGPAYSPIYQSASFQRSVPFGNYVNTYTNATITTSEQETLYTQGVFSPPTIYGTRGYYRAGSTQYGSPTPIYNRSTSAQFFTQYVRDPGSGTGVPGFPNILNFSRVFTRASFTRLVTGPTYFRNVTNYTASLYQRQFTRRFTAQYLGQYNGPQYTRGFTRIFSGQYTRRYTGNFNREFTRAFTRLVVGPQYDVGTFDRLNTGPQYTRQFTRIYSGQYSRQYARITPGPQYTQQFQRNEQYGGIYYRDSYATAYAGPIYSDGYLQFFRGFDRQPYYRAPIGYTNPEDPYSFYSRGYFREQFSRNTGAQYSPGVYSPGVFYRFDQAQIITGFYTANFDRITFSRIFSAQYTRAQYTRIVTGPQYNGPQYTRQYTAPYVAQFTRQFSGNYSAGVYNQAYNVNYFRTTYSTDFSRGTQFTRIVVGPDYSRGTQYQRQFDRGQFSRITIGPKYNGEVYASVKLQTFIGGYVRSYTGQYNGLYAQQYSRVFSAQYSRLTVGPQYASDFDVYARGYSGQYSRLTIGDQYTREFSGNTVRSDDDVAYTETITTLWLRVA